MTDLEKYINDSNTGVDPLINVALIHHQFESIHPFYDGNGRAGRIINILYIVKEGLLETPILYLSRYINKNKSDYYRLLQTVRDTNNRNEWILFMLTAVEQTAKQTITIIESIKTTMLSHKKIIRDKLPKIYSQDLLNNIFRHPYTKIEFIVNDLRCTRKTAAKYLDTLVGI
jgi:Fic family protein